MNLIGEALDLCSESSRFCLERLDLVLGGHHLLLLGTGAYLGLSGERAQVGLGGQRGGLGFGSKASDLVLGRAVEDRSFECLVFLLHLDLQDRDELALLKIVKRPLDLEASHQILSLFLLVQRLINTVVERRKSLTEIGFITLKCLLGVLGRRLRQLQRHGVEFEVDKELEVAALEVEGLVQIERLEVRLVVGPELALADLGILNELFVPLLKAFQ